MNRIFALILCAATLFAFCACGNNASETGSVASAEKSAEESGEASQQAPEPIDLSRHMRDFKAEKGDAPIPVKEIVEEVKSVLDLGRPVIIKRAFNHSMALRQKERGHDDGGLANGATTEGIVDFSKEPYDADDLYYVFLSALGEFDDRIYDSDTYDGYYYNRVVVSGLLYFAESFEKLGYKDREEAYKARVHQECWMSDKAAVIRSRSESPETNLFYEYAGMEEPKPARIELKPDETDFLYDIRCFKAARADGPITIQELFGEIKRICASGKKIIVSPDAEDEHLSAFAQSTGDGRYLGIVENGSGTLGFSETPCEANDIYFLLLVALEAFEDRVYGEVFYSGSGIEWKTYKNVYSDVPFKQLGYENAEEAYRALTSGECKSDYYNIASSFATSWHYSQYKVYSGTSTDIIFWVFAVPEPTSDN